MKFRRQRIEDGGINLTPLIDVVFLLLIFFMVSTTFTKESRLQIELPTATGEPPPEERMALEIVVDSQGQYRINEKALQGRDIDALMAAIERLAEGDTDMPVMITADANSPHQAVVTAMDAAGRLGFSRLSLTTQKPQGGQGPN
ncbi:biopolymer transporter ExbD [Spongiibacter taiwanensis]|uniref:ExbD/TolR family protein n=1 Tax=Spongiibacter taiwanensis TaxID=1748242 RepID=UPI0020360E23|nr:biopolymer transporter ExbD [Spongiibacter taiwanensis]USA43514.1 biopolymer transporter ExbD [Spongiibacter taiwanensis]